MELSQGCFYTGTKDDETMITKIKNTRTTTKLIVGQIVTLILALLAGALAIYGLTSNIRDVQESRIVSRKDSCQIERGGLFVAAGPVRYEQMKAYIDRSDLNNCDAYSRLGTVK